MLTSMEPDHIQAMAARCLVDADFLSTIFQRLQGLPGGSPDARDAAQLFEMENLERIALFQAFIVKVKHNGVRDVLPLTFRLLSAAGEELAFYRGYAASYLSVRAAGPLELANQVELMAEHLGRFAKRCPNPAAANLDDVLAHELQMWRLRGDEPAPGLQFVDDALSWRGRMELLRYRTDVARACAALAAKTFDPARDLVACEKILAYWRPPQSDAVESFEVDELTAALFSTVDGRRTVDDIAAGVAAMGLDQITRDDVAEFFDELEERGFIRSSRSAVQPG